MFGNKLSGKSVVITGASSGLGRCTALSFAKEGARVALIARNKEGLRTLRQQIERDGGQALEFSVDVTDFDALKSAADQVAKMWGGIDVWVNGAAVALYGEGDRVPLDEMRRVMDVNYFGQLHGVRVAMPYLEKAKGGGRLIAVLSALARSSVPLQSAYVASKHALYGYYSCLQEELLHRGSPVSLSVLLASSIATPITTHAKTYIGYRPKPVPPIYPPERFARAILKLARKPKFESVVGGFGHAAIAMAFDAPRFNRWYQSKTAYSAQQSKEPKGASEGDNLFSPMPETSEVRGADPVSYRINWVEENSRWILGLAALVGSVAVGSRWQGRLTRGSTEQDRQATEGLAKTLGLGMLAGVAGSLVMAAFQKLIEMPISQREDSYQPAKLAQKLLPIDPPKNDQDWKRLTYMMHFTLGAMWGGAYGVAAFKGLRGSRAVSRVFPAIYTNDVVVGMILGLGKPPWKWSRKEFTIDVVDKFVQVAATSFIFDRVLDPKPTRQPYSGAYRTEGAQKFPISRHRLAS